MFQSRDSQTVESATDNLSPERSGPGSGSFDEALDEARNLLRVTGRGIWSLDYLDRHFIQTELLLRPVRARGKPLNVLIDLREAQVPPPEIIAKLMSGGRKIYRPNDRIAVVVGSCLMKMEMRRAVKSEAAQIFISLAAAEMWLFAWA